MSASHMPGWSLESIIISSMRDLRYTEHAFNLKFPTWQTYHVFMWFRKQAEGLTGDVSMFFFFFVFFFLNSSALLL